MTTQKSVLHKVATKWKKILIHDSFKVIGILARH